MERLRIKGNQEWHVIDHIETFKPLPIQHHPDEGWPEKYVCEDGVEVCTDAPFIERDSDERE